jgi:hypothetical protein
VTNQSAINLKSPLQIEEGISASAIFVGCKGEGEIRGDHSAVRFKGDRMTSSFDEHSKITFRWSSP